MVPYHGKHSAKMYIKSKPIRFGYKLWVLAGPDRYPYHIPMYTGKSQEANTQPLGTRVVTGLLETISTISRPQAHNVFFDKFFTSYDLLRDLHARGFRATGTIRQNHSGGANKEKNGGTPCLPMLSIYLW